MLSVIIPAHNESATIARTLQAITDGADPAEIEVIVVCNGCTDETAAVVRQFGHPVRVIETTIASKTYALNLGDQAASKFPRVYVDADVVVALETLQRLADRLEQGDVLAVAPLARMELTECSWFVRAFYEIRGLLPSSGEGIGGSGVYVLSRAGRERFGSFPDVIADDGFVRIQFSSAERATLASAHSTVFPPRTIRALLGTKTRAHQGSFELYNKYPALWRNRGESNNRALLRLLRNPCLWVKLAVYSSVTVLARNRARKRLREGFITWERDMTSRSQT